MPQEASPLHATIKDSVKEAMRAKDKNRLAALRQMTAAIKQAEVDSRQDITDDEIITILTKMTKQRKEALGQYEKAGRDDLAEVEKFELAILEEFMPAQLSEEEIRAEVDAAIAETGASSIKDMGSVMNVLRPKVQGRADMSVVSSQVKSALNS